ncbi:MAG: hypothetical protein WCC58_07595, partial [Burkholderiales bacterium]
MDYVNKTIFGLWLAAVLLFALVALAVGYSHSLYLQYDISLNARQSLAPASVNLLRDMKGPVHV